MSPLFTAGVHRIATRGISSNGKLSLVYVFKVIRPLDAEARLHVVTRSFSTILEIRDTSLPTLAIGILVGFFLLDEIASHTHNA